ncbi:MAG: aminotransferase class V-fold PLP-dependent enzyme [Ignavibacteriales bacterium]|nr:aminotransferase class V-fold PLP-dependent enzyme [Ignavibacteriales bacterium]
MNIEEVRKLFPHLQTDQIYFNHAALGPWSTLVLDRIKEYMNERSGLKVMNYESFIKWNFSAKEKLAKLLGTSTSRLSWADNVANSMSIIAQGLDWKSGDRIILNDIEFPSNVYPFLNLKKHGVEIDFAKSRNGIVDIEDIEKLIIPKTKLISISMVQFLSGYKADIDAIGELCKQKGIIFCVDAIQAVGAVQIDLKNSPIDFLTGGTQKWLMSSQGLSYFYVTEELQNKIDQKNVGWTSVEDPWNLLDYNLTLRSNAERFQTGTLNALGIAIFDAALKMFKQSKDENFELRVLENTNYFINKLSDIGIEPLLKNISNKHLAGIVTFQHDKSKEIFSELEKRKIYGAVREGMIRFSPHFYNTKDEIDRVVNELKNIAG